METKQNILMERDQEKNQKKVPEKELTQMKLMKKKIISFIKMTSSQLKKKQILHYLIILTQNILKILHKANMD